MAKENTGLYLFFLVAGLFYVYYRHEQQTGGGAIPPGSAPSGVGILGGLLDFLGGVGTAATAGAPTTASHPAARPVASHPAARPAVHPIAAHPGAPSPYAQWQAIMAPPTGAQAHFGCSTCAGSRIGTWFDEGEPYPEMEVLPRYESFGNVGSLY